MRYSYIVVSMVLLLSACGESYYYQESRSIGDDGWTDGEVFDFNFDIKDTMQHYNLYLDLYHTKDYPYQNLYLKIDTRYPDQHTISDTLSFDLANAVGDWNGKCSSDACDLRVFLAHQIRFEQLGDYRIGFTQYSRFDTIPEIKNISFKIQAIDPKS